MKILTWGRRGVTLSMGARLVLAAVLVFCVASAGSHAAGGSPPRAESNVVLTGSYTCTYAVTSYYNGPDQPPATYAETSDSLTMSTTGGLVPTRMVESRGSAGGGSVLTSPVSGLGTGHSFTDGSIEDCVRFAQSMAATAAGLECATSAQRRRQPPGVPSLSNPSASFSFVCEGSAAEMVHVMGELSRAVLALNLQPAH
jgi:hypothetical protein